MSNVPNRVAAAHSLLADFERACAGTQPPDWRVWTNRLAGALSSMTSLAKEEHRERQATVALNCELADLLEITSNVFADLGVFTSTTAA